MFRSFYTALTYLLCPLFLLRLLYKSRQLPAYKERMVERLGIYHNPVAPTEIWIHAVSFGEVELASALIKHYLKQGKRITVTTGTPTGAHHVKSLFSSQVQHLYLPFDLPIAVNRFLKKLSPHVAIIVETEIWPNLLRGCAKRHLPVVLVNARISERSYQHYRLIRTVISQALQHIHCVVAQSEEDGARFIKLGLTPSRLVVGGNIKFDTAATAATHQTHEMKQLTILKRALFGERKIVLAASTHPGEETMILDAWQYIHPRHPDVLLLLAPRHPERSEEVSKLIIKYGWTVSRRSDAKKAVGDQSIFLLDTLGELKHFYSMASLAFVGGSLVKHGGHNVLEPISLGVPVLTGPYMHNFMAIKKQLLAVNALVEVDSVATLAQAMELLLVDKQKVSQLRLAAKQVLEQNRGALNKHLQALAPFLEAN